MKQKIKTLSMAAQTVLILIISIIFLCSVFFYFMQITVKKAVAEQIVQGTENAMNLASVQIQNLVLRGLSALLSVSQNKQIQDFLKKLPRTPIARLEYNAHITEIIQGAYYFLDEQMSIAIISRNKDIFTNWYMFNSESLFQIFDEYLAYKNSDVFTPSTLFTRTIKNVHLELSANTAQDYYCMIIPIEQEQFAQEPILLGIAMILFPVNKLNQMICFDQQKIHNTFLVNNEEFIVACQNPDLIGTSFQEYYRSIDGNNSMMLTEKKVRHSQLALIDLMPKSTINKHTYTIMQNTIVFILALIVLILIIIAKITEQNRIREQEKRRSEIQALQSQIRPHFLFNVLNTIRCTIMNNHLDKAANMVLKLSLLLRRTLYKGDEFVSLVEEVETAGFYLDIMKMRHAAQFEFACFIQPEAEDFMLPKLLLQPLVENAYMHGIEKKEGTSLIRIEAAKNHDFIVIQVKDSANLLQDEIIGAELKEPKPNSTGIGLANVHKRIALYFGAKSFLRVYSSTDGWSVSEIQIYTRGIT